MVFPFGALAPDGRKSGHQWHSRGQRFDPAYLHHSMFYGLYSAEYKPFLFPAKNEYRDDAGSFRRRLSILPPAEKGLFHESKDRENGLFVAPENSADNCIHRNTFAN